MLLREGVAERTAFGAWIKLAAIESVEILDAAGFDFAVVDMEHTLLDTASVQQHLVVGRALGMPMLVRVPDANPSRIQRLLDGGAAGILAPHVDDVATAKGLVASSHFPPRGTRGSGGTSRSGGFGLRERDAYLGGGGGVVAQIESVAAVRDASAIASVEGLAALMLGPADLELDPRRSELPNAADVAAGVIAAARGAGVLAGTACTAAAALARAAAGFDFVICASDVTMLATAAHDVVRSLHAREEPSDG
ncbi:aldolase/citrate lyase family protein [Agrococcus sp. ARC_14]|uniref:HpcH/HpaI aldolase family protein n=1 Tax=Agrococcus sp. ARC_14 TaxID=2919927 RepID=UPI001F05D8D7|nr:aldolase/citrate lyase family protein [Agrococcus sp. ARC_14]MCH1881347.1 aldolase/citrate lyase family protein [Agrococcus sp. ARC_14]